MHAAIPDLSQRYNFEIGSISCFYLSSMQKRQSFFYFYTEKSLPQIRQSYLLCSKYLTIFIEYTLPIVLQSTAIALRKCLMFS